MSLVLQISTALLGKKKDSRLIKPKIKGEVLPKHKLCPFFGFTGMMGMMMDTKGNGCGLAGGHTPCYMEITDGKKVDWQECLYNTPENNQLLLDSAEFPIFPDELNPKQPEGWEGVPLSEWLEMCTEHTIN